MTDDLKNLASILRERASRVTNPIERIEILMRAARIDLVLASEAEDQQARVIARRELFRLTESYREIMHLKSLKEDV